MRTQRGFASGLLALSALLALAGCGGGGGGGGGPRNTAPSANAGADQTARRSATVTLDGTASTDTDGDTLAYRWTQTGGTPVTLSSTTASRPTFTAPNEAGALNFALTTNDGKVDSTTDAVTITVENSRPTAVVAAPTMAVGYGQLAVLDATASTDADGDPLTYTWTQVSGTPVELTEVAPGISHFRAPYGPEVFVFSLAVSDGEATSQTVNFTIDVTTIVPPPSPPYVYAGHDQEVARRSTVILYGWASDPNNDTLTYSWEQVAGPTVTLSNVDELWPTFTAPETPVELRFALRASDGALTSRADEVVVNVKNFAPEVYNAAITPAAPKTADTLVAAGDVSDPDNDAVTTTYAWSRNGTLVSSQTSSTFPASLTTKNDVIAVQITVDDGHEQATVDASTVILDSPAVLSGQTPPPTTLNYGDTATFSVRATDPDGDTITGYEVAFGPAGFSVSPDGDVTWTAAGPLFDRVTDFNWGVRVTGDASSLLAGTIAVTDAARVYPLRRTNLSIPVQHSGLRIADLDGDGDREILVGSLEAVYVLSKSGAEYQQSWVYPFDVGNEDIYGDGVHAVTAADIDGDGRQEIYFSKGGQLVRLDGVSRREAVRTELRCRGLEVADLDGNGSPELVCLGTSSNDYWSDGRILVLNASTLAELWSTPEVNLGSAMAVGNVDGDAALEIVASGGFVYDGGTHDNQWAYSQPFGDGVDTGDMDADGVEEIIGLQTWVAVRAYSAVQRSPLWEYAPASFTDLDSVVVADANGDGRLEAVAGNAQGGNVLGISYNTATHQPEVMWEIDSLESGVSSIAVGDVDADGVNEIVWGTGAGSSGRDQVVIAGFTPAISYKWRSDSMAELNGPFYGGELARIGGGATRLMFAVSRSNSSYSGARAIALTPMTGEVESSGELGTNWARSTGFAVADYDNDNIDELFLGTASLYDGYFMTYDFAAESIGWQSPQFEDGAVAAKQADMNGDGHADLVGLTSNGYIEIHDVHAQSLIWRSTQLGYSIALALADLDGDGEQEIIVATTERIVIYGQGLLGMTYLERASIAHADAMDVLAADLDGDSEPEIYVLSSPYSNANLDVFDADLQPVRSLPLGARASALFVEKSAFSRKNLLLSLTGDWYPSSANSELWAIDPVTGADIWRSPPLAGAVPRNGLQFVDVNGDGFDEIAFGTAQGMYHTR